MSPPEIWLHDETNTTKYVVLLDFAASLVLWGTIAFFSFQRALSRTHVPWKLQWPCLLCLALAVAVPGSWFVEPDYDSGVQEHAFPLSDYLTVFSMLVDVVAIVPQVRLGGI